MERNYSLTENPFIYGFQHISLEITHETCGTETLYYMLQPRFGLPARPSFMRQSHNLSPLNHSEKTAYYIGRTMRFPLVLVGTITDLALQMLQSLATTLEYGIIKLESLVTNEDPFITRSVQMLNVVSLSRAFACMREKTTIAEPTFLARDLGLIGEYEQVKSFSSKYRAFLHASIF